MKTQNWKKLIGLALTTAVVLSAGTAVFAEESAEADVPSYFKFEVNAEIPAPEGDDNTIVFGVVPTPHGEVAEQVKGKLEDAGWKLEIVTYEDYVQPNNALDSGDLDANYFQHYPYLADFNEKNGTDLVGVAAVHFEPLGIYAGKTQTLEEIPDGAVIAVPNDTTNEARALLLLQANGLITLKEGAGLQATVIDIEDNPHNIKIQELEAVQTARVIDEVDFSVVNGNYAIDANIRDRLVTMEDAASEAAQTYANLIVVKAGNEETAKTKAISAAILSDEIRDFITNTYEGAVVAVF